MDNTYGCFGSITVSGGSIDTETKREIDYHISKAREHMRYAERLRKDAKSTAEFKAMKKKILETSMAE